MILAILTIILVLFNRLFEETTHSVVSSIKAGTYFMNNKIEENRTHTTDIWLVITPYHIEDAQSNNYDHEATTLHLLSFKTPAKRAVMSGECHADCASSMRNGVNEKWFKPHLFMDLYDIRIRA